jgi:hypothetical protein
VTAPIPGDPVYLGSFLANTHWYGVVGDGETPAMQVATMEAVGQDAVIALDALKGDKGDQGDPAEIIHMVYDADIDSPSDLPTASAANAWDRPLTSDDVGFTFWVGNLVYMWTGDHYITKPMGSPGQTGATPDITFTVEAADPEAEPTVEESGTVNNPVLKFKMPTVIGPEGPAAAISLASDYDDSQLPDFGQVLTWTDMGDGDGLWKPSDFAAKHPRMYSVPEAAFTDFSGLAQRHTILAYTMEAQDYDYVPWVTGHIKAFGVELDADPLTIGVEVRLGDATSGQLIGRGFGNNSKWSHITPHFSSSDDTTTAVAPDNGVALVPAGQTATINVNLYNDGLLGAYIFHNTGAQLTILTVPQGD